MPGVHYGVREGDRVALIDQHHEPGQERIENGNRGQVLDITDEGGVFVEFDVTGRTRTLQGDDLARLRLGYAQHIGTEGHDTQRIGRLAEQMRRSHAQTPSLAHPELPDMEYGPGYRPVIAPSRQRAIPGLARALHRIVQAPERTQERSR